MALSAQTRSSAPAPCSGSSGTLTRWRRGLPSRCTPSTRRCRNCARCHRPAAGPGSSPGAALHSPPASPTSAAASPGAAAGQIGMPEFGPVGELGVIAKPELDGVGHILVKVAAKAAALSGTPVMRAHVFSAESAASFQPYMKNTPSSVSREFCQVEMRWSFCTSAVRSFAIIGNSITDGHGNNQYVTAHIFAIPTR
jgi:hypothetical protein